VTGDGAHSLEYRSVDEADHVETAHTLTFSIDATAPVISGMPAACTVWPVTNKLVSVAAVVAADLTSGIAPGSFSIGVTSNEPLAANDAVVNGGSIELRASRSGGGSGRAYTIVAAVSDLAGNTATATASCTVPHDQSGK
jgi:hypothetical protein